MDASSERNPRWKRTDEASILQLFNRLLTAPGFVSDLEKLFVMERAESGNRPLLPDVSRGPLLLVSVRSPEEANAALRGGADILDVKEPRRGSLGMADIEVIAAIARQLADSNHDQTPRATFIPLSVALGEVHDWRDARSIPPLPESVTFAKLGLSHLAPHNNWSNEWLRVRHLFEERRTARLNWVAVAYADADAATSPPIDDVLTAAIDTNCSGLLIDTFTKTGLTLTDCCDLTSLAQLAERCHSAGLFLALAGRLTRESLPTLSRIPADVFAIRSAACEAATREGRVTEPAVADFRMAMRTVLTSAGIAINEGKLPIREASVP